MTSGAYLTDDYSELLDCIVTEILYEERGEDNDLFPVLTMLHPSGTTFRVTVSADGEGSSGGVLFVEEMD